MSSDLFIDQFRRLISEMAPGDHASLDESGFLDLLKGEDDGGAGMALEDLFPLVLEAARHPAGPEAVRAIVARALTSETGPVADLEATLAAGGLEAGRAKAVAAGVTAALMAGAMVELLEMTREYALTRKQFGREIGRFQAVQHHLAVMAEEAMAARMAAQVAFQGAAGEMSTALAAVAKARAGQAAMQVAAIAHAVFGAIGISQEHALHRFTGALHQGRMSHGGEAYWARRLGRIALSEGQPQFVQIARAL